MRREAHFTHSQVVKGEWTDEVVYAMLEDEWRARCPNAAPSPESATADPSRTVASVRLATFNVMQGRSPSDGLVDLPRLCEAVAAAHARAVPIADHRPLVVDLTEVSGRVF